MKCKFHQLRLSALQFCIQHYFQNSCICFTLEKKEQNKAKSNTKHHHQQKHTTATKKTHNMSVTERIFLTATVTKHSGQKMPQWQKIVLHLWPFLFSLGFLNNSSALLLGWYLMQPGPISCSEKCLLRCVSFWYYTKQIGHVASSLLLSMHSKLALYHRCHLLIHWQDTRRWCVLANKCPAAKSLTQ